MKIKRVTNTFIPYKIYVESAMEDRFLRHMIKITGDYGTHLNQSEVQSFLANLEISMNEVQGDKESD